MVSNFVIIACESDTSDAILQGMKRALFLLLLILSWQVSASGLSGSDCSGTLTIQVRRAHGDDHCSSCSVSSAMESSDFRYFSYEKPLTPLTFGSHSYKNTFGPVLPLDWRLLKDGFLREALYLHHCSLLI